MQGLNPLTMQCAYSTPCGWCAKWDKKCDKKIGCGDEKPQRGLRAKSGIFIDDSIKNCLNCVNHGKDLFVCDTCEDFDCYEKEN